jgi:hypothetical protein
MGIDYKGGEPDENTNDRGCSIGERRIGLGRRKDRRQPGICSGGLDGRDNPRMRGTGDFRGLQETDRYRGKCIAGCRQTVRPKPQKKLTADAKGRADTIVAFVDQMGLANAFCDDPESFAGIYRGLKIQ